MSIPTYAVVNDLPAPVTSGSGVQSFTDVWGDVWVAANGVNAGAWRRARDVLHAKWYRNAAYTTTTAQGVVPWDTMVRDPYGLYVTAQNGFVVPVAGMYRYTATLQAAATAASQFLWLRVLQNGVMVSTFNNYSGGTGNNISAINATEIFCNAGDLLQSAQSTTAAMNIVVGIYNVGECHYTGTG